MLLLLLSPSLLLLLLVPFREMGFNLIKREVRDAIKLRYDLPVMIFLPLDYVAIFLQLTTQ